MENLIVGQSGGPTAVINSSLAGVIQNAISREEIDKVYGMINGVDGFLNDRMIELSHFQDKEIELLKTTPGAYLGSCRYKLPEDMKSPVYDQIFHKLEELNISYFLYIGGNDSMDTISKLSKQAVLRKSNIVFLGIAKTVDNDLMYTDHTPGFGSAAKYVASSVRNVVADTDAYNMKSVTIIEIMGRHAGWLTGSTVLARRYLGDNPALIYLPEIPFDDLEFIEAVKKELEKRNSVVVCVSEGVQTKEGVFVCEQGSNKQEDEFGHKLLSGAAMHLESLVAKHLGIKVRSFNMGLTQRCSSQALSKSDVDEAFMAGVYGVNQGLIGETGKMVSFVRKQGSVYDIECGLVDVDLVCNQEKTVPMEWISASKTDLTKEFIDYISPLIQGEIYPKIENGLPVFLTLEKM